MELTVDNLRRVFRYDPDTGVLTRVARIGRSGKLGPVGSLSKGYVQVPWCGKKLKAHRVAWALVTGAWPEHELDHRNGIRSDNRWSNLRELTTQQNAENASRRRDNRSGTTGVFFHQHTCKWWAYINVKGVRTTLGYFEKKEDAITARLQAKLRLHMHADQNSLSA